MMLFLYGDDSFRSREKLRELETKFSLSNGNTNITSRKHVRSTLNIIHLAGASVTFGEIHSSINTQSLLSKKCLIILHDFISLNKNKKLHDYVAELVLSSEIPENNSVIFYESGTCSKSHPVYKALEGKKSKHDILSFEFKPLIGNAIDRWIQERVLCAEHKIDSRATALLASFVGNDLWRLSHEIDKLVMNTKETGIISPEVVTEMVNADIHTNIFEFIDALGQKNVKRSLALLHDHLDSGQDPLYLLTMIVYQFRNLLKIKSLLEEGMQKSEIVKRTKLHPFVVGKTIAQSKNFTLSELVKIYKKLFDADVSLKQGEIEPIIAFDAFVVALCS